MIIESYCEEDTKNLAMITASEAKRGDIFCLDGDLGTGKTVFAKGFAEGLGINEPITSPTFNIVKEYKDGKFPLYHFDVYRISDPDEMYAIGYEEYFYGKGVCLIEWSELISDLIPKEAIRVRIEKDPEKGFDYRRIVYD
ncbi:MAG: tRNA (adenosine(37)-N6)-threonylcarbamoyltransferase complex ATPase subunit type 1 TsaE [Eubacteriales bacterium]|nr:tRNA (adenosine(37)-N6)-threonylcarbamoyltransferase complex ATPase subunit type 1 TsaE [Eubacteriales bacterium]